MIVLSLGACAHRSVENISGAHPYGATIKRVRIEMANGSLGIVAPEAGSDENTVFYAGGLRRDANDAEDLAKLDAVPAALTAAPDPEDPTTLVIRGPEAPDGVSGMIAYEGSVRLPPGMPLEVQVRNNGHITMVGRRAFTKVRTRRGDLRFEGCHGGVEANTGQGVLIAFDHEGDIDVRTALGDMQVFVDRPGDEITLSTGKGTVQCQVPDDFDFEVDARVEIGRIGNDFDFEVRKVGEYSAAMTGSKGAAKTKVILRTAAGHISLIKRKSE